MHHAFPLYISWPSLHDYDVKIPSFTFYGERKQATTNFFFLFLNMSAVSKKFKEFRRHLTFSANCSKLDRVLVWKNPNSSGVFAAVAVVDAKAPSEESRTQGSEEGAPGSLPAWNAFVRLKKVDCKTVGFFLKISKEIGKARRKSLTREPQTPVWGERKKTSLPSLALCFQPRCRPFVWLPRVFEFTLKYRRFCSLEKSEKLTPVMQAITPGPRSQVEFMKKQKQKN